MYGLDYTINRFFSVYGPRMDCEGAYTEVIFNWLSQIHKGNNEITVYGNPDEKILDLVYVEDVVNAIILTTFNSNKDVFNVSTQFGISLTKLIEVVELVTGKHLKVNKLPENRNDVENKRVGDTTKLKNLGWFDNTTIIGGIRKTNEWIAGLE